MFIFVLYFSKNISYKFLVACLILFGFNLIHTVERTVLLDGLKLLKMGRKIKPVPRKSQLETDTEIDKTADQPKASSSSTPEVHSQHVKPEVSLQEPEGLVIPILEERNPISERLEELKDLSNTAGKLYHCTAIPSI